MQFYLLTEFLPAIGWEIESDIWPGAWTVALHIINQQTIYYNFNCKYNKCLNVRHMNMINETQCGLFANTRWLKHNTTRKTNLFNFNYPISVESSHHLQVKRPRSKSLMLNFQWGVSCAIHSAVLLKSHVIGMQTIYFRSKEVANNRPIVVAFDSVRLTNVLLKQLWTD